MEDDDLVDPVEELGSEDRAQRVDDLVLHAFVGAVVRAAGVARDELAADVAGHDQDGVAEVDRPALAVGQASVIKHLQQDVEHVGVRLLDLVEQHHLVRPAADGFGQLTALVVAHVAGRCADQPADRELLHVLAHVDARQRLLVIKEELGECPRQLRLTDTGRAPGR